MPDVLDNLAVGLVDTKLTKLGKIGEKLLLILGLAHMNFPLCYMAVRLSDIGELKNGLKTQKRLSHINALCINQFY